MRDLSKGIKTLARLRWSFLSKTDAAEAGKGHWKRSAGANPCVRVDWPRANGSQSVKKPHRHGEQAEDPSLLDFKLKEYRATKMVVAEASDRSRWKKAGVRRLIRKSKLSQKAVYAILSGKGVRPQTLATFRSAAELLRA